MLGILGVLALGGIAGLKLKLAAQDDPLPSIASPTNQAPITTFLENLENTEGVTDASEVEEEIEAAAEVVDYSKMKTLVLIPTEPAPEDPSWMMKRHAGRKLSAEESQQYYEHIYNQSLERL